MDVLWSPLFGGAVYKECRLHQQTIFPRE